MFLGKRPKNDLVPRAVCVSRRVNPNNIPIHRQKSHVLAELQIASLVFRNVSDTNDRLECPNAEDEYTTADE